MGTPRQMMARARAANGGARRHGAQLVGHHAELPQDDLGRGRLRRAPRLHQVGGRARPPDGHGEVADVEEVRDRQGPACGGASRDAPRLEGQRVRSACARATAARERRVVSVPARRTARETDWAWYLPEDFAASLSVALDCPLPWFLSPPGEDPRHRTTPARPPRASASAASPRNARAPKRGRRGQQQRRLHPMWRPVYPLRPPGLLGREASREKTCVEVCSECRPIRGFRSSDFC